MRIFTTSIFVLLSTALLLGQQAIADFENFGLSTGEFINQDTEGQGFQSGYVSLPNTYFPSYDSWSGWAISAASDVTTPGFTNQYSAITGAGFDGSTAYAVAFEFGENIIRVNDGEQNVRGMVNGMYITNGTYAYLSMLEGDAFAKKFGGETGEDPDFFSIIFKGYKDSELSSDSVEFFLADFRSSDSSEDYIVNDWVWADLTSLGFVDSISISMRSSDVGAYGINTPLYFCVDNIDVNLDITNTSSPVRLKSKVYPTLVQNSLTVELPSAESTIFNVVSIDGKILKSDIILNEKNTIDLTYLPSGYYYIDLRQGNLSETHKVLKL